MVMELPDEPKRPKAEEAPRLPVVLGSGLLYCESCRQETPHRILRVKPEAGATLSAVSGVARCRVCRLTHTFRSVRESRVERALVVSDGDRSTHLRVSMVLGRTVRVGSEVPDYESPLRVTRIDTSDGRSVLSSPAPEVATIWAVRTDETAVHVSILEGARTSSGLLRVPPSTRLEVGAELDLGENRIVIVGLRARRHTWRRAGDAFPATEVQRIYGRRTLTPPAGNRAWRTVRDRPRSRASSTSLAGRSRSSPGARRTDAAPRASIAARGATIQRSSPS